MKKQIELTCFAYKSVLSSMEAFNFKFGKVGKITGKTRQKNEKKIEKRRKPLPDATPNTGFLREGRLFYFDQFLLHGMLIPYLTLKSSLIFQIVTYWGGTAWSVLGFNPFCRGECVWAYELPLCEFLNLCFAAKNIQFQLS